MLIKSTFETIESPLFQARHETTQAECQNLTNSKNLTNDFENVKKDKTPDERQGLKSEKIWSRFL